MLIRSIVAALLLVTLPAAAQAASRDGSCDLSGSSASAELSSTLDVIAGSPAMVAMTFYDAFVTSDAATMERLYSPTVRFQDPIFEYSDRAGAMKMWRFLFKNKGKGTFRYELLGATGDTASVRWIADYEIFGRPVHNVIDTKLTIRDGKIVKHEDLFSWEAWSAQALPFGRFSELPALRWTVTRALRAVVRHS